MFRNTQLKIFCCCYNLKTGSLVIGTLGWLLTLFQLFYLTSPIRQKTYDNSESNTEIALEISYCVITLITCILLIYGAYKNNRNCVIPWLIVKFVDCLAWTAITVFVFVQFFMVIEILPKIFFFFVLFFDTTLNWYFWVCVWSLYKELNDRTITEKEDEVMQTIQIEEVKSQDPDCDGPIFAV